MAQSSALGSSAGRPPRPPPPPPLPHRPSQRFLIHLLRRLGCDTRRSSGSRILAVLSKGSDPQAQMQRQRRQTGSQAARGSRTPAVIRPQQVPAGFIIKQLRQILPTLRRQPEVASKIHVLACLSKHMGQIAKWVTFQSCLLNTGPQIYGRKTGDAPYSLYHPHSNPAPFVG